RKIASWLLVSAILLCYSGYAPAAEPQEGQENPAYGSYRDIPGVTEGEISAIEELKSHRSSFVYGMNLSTETFLKLDGGIGGYSALFCGWLTELFGIPFEPGIYEWGDLLAGLESRDIDFTGELTATEERRRTYFMTDAIAERSVKYMRIAGGEALYDIAKSRALRYAFLDGTTTYDQVRSLEQNRIDVTFIDDYETAYDMLKKGDIDAFFDEGIAEAAFDEYGDVVATEFYPLIYGPVSLTTQNPELEPIISVVQKALHNGAAHRLIVLYNQGHRAYLSHKLFIQLDDEERRYISEHVGSNRPVPVAAEYDNYPTSFFNDQEGEWQGVALDVLSEIGALTGLKFETVNGERTEWYDLMARLENGEAAMITELIRSAERDGRFLWPDTPYQTDYYALLSRTEFENVDVNEVLYSKVGLMRDTAFSDVFHKWFPNHSNTVEYVSTNDAFMALESGEVDLVMATRNLLLSMTNFQERPGFKSNLVFKYPFESAFGFNKNEAVLCSIVSKSLRLIDTEGISDRWTRRVFDYRGKMAQARIPWFIAASGLMFCLLSLLSVMFLRRRQEEKKLEMTVRERTKELARQDSLLHTVNDAASLLLASDYDEFENALRRGMEMMANCVGVDRIYIWKNKMRNDELYYALVFRWTERESGRDGESSAFEFSYVRSFPEWEDKFLGGQCVNGPLKNLSPVERDRLSPYGVKSILVVPVFLQDKFWGFVSFDDCSSEREFSKDEESILRSGSLLLANAMTRNETFQTLRSELDRQKVLAAVASNMTNPHSFRDNVNFALKSVGQFMNVDSISILKDHPGEELFECTFEWSGDGSDPHLGRTTSYAAPDGGTLPEYAMISRLPFVAADDLSEMDENLYAGARGEGVLSLFNLPIYVEGKFWGGILLNSMTGARAWSESDINFLQTLGAILGRSFENDVIRQNLSESASRFEAVVNNYTGVIWSVNRDNVIESFNGLYLEALGLDPQVLVGKPFPAAGLQNPLFDITEQVERTFADGAQAWNSEMDDRVFSFHTAPIVDKDGRTSGVVGNCVDITQMVTMQKQLERSIEKAHAASRAKSDFLSNMSHEMRTPMNAIIGMTSIAKSSDDIDRKDYCLGKIEDASVHLLGVINDILDMSKIEANKFELSYAEFDFEKMLLKVTNIINFRIDEKHQDFTVHIDSRIPRNLISDDQRLAQVITNLLGNSVKFTPDQGSISLGARLLDEEDGVCTIQIDVTDTGIGVSEEQQSRLFTSFEQAESSTSRKFGGTGLGLAISKRIVELMGGEIWVKSELGKGSVFAFTVRARRGQETQHGLLNPGVDWKNIRILVVDDSPDVLEYMGEIMRGLGVACDMASSGPEALELIRKNGPYDVCLVDWKMPGMDGIELSGRIKEHREGKSVVIMISTTEWSVIEDDARRAGVDKFLPKPIFPSAIADCINECLGVADYIAANEAKADEIDCFEGYRVLLAEDVEINREIVSTLLEPTRLAIEYAENGAEAVRMFGADPDRYDMIFMDVQMPEMDGYEA
ncbi:MAG: response regulator, partial [Synergistaceae bacterium]|nr:response regulator [Synergistaceae bacterium]